jgi:hypothetical protein
MEEKKEKKEEEREREREEKVSTHMLRVAFFSRRIKPIFRLEITL